MSGSSLKFFADAKACIGKLGSNLFETVTSEKEFLKEDDLISNEMMEEGMAEQFESYCEKIKGVLEMVERNSMKVVFFGRTSNGKSTVINAMLKRKILPSGLGHTTNCFVQVEGFEGDEACLVTEDGKIGNIRSLGELTSALSERRLSSDSLIRLRWPKRHCKLLQEDVVFVDSPGIDLSADVDQWIDKFCLDADVFVLVVNAESTLMQTEKNFFHRVSTRLSKPNVFILNNRWDASSYEQDTINEVREQHEDRCSDFLLNELQCITPHELPNRIFFVSAQETLRKALSSSSSSQPFSLPSPARPEPQLSASSSLPQPSSLTSSPSKHDGAYKEGCEARLKEFEVFEDSFEQCISKAAVETKFSHHVTSLRRLNRDLISLWQSVCHEALRLKNAKVKELAQLNGELSFLQDSSVNISQHIKKTISNTASDLNHQMNNIIRYEVDNLPSIVDEFQKTFDPDDYQLLNNYKRDLSFYVEECLTRNLHLRYTPLARKTLCAVSKQLIDSFSNMLPEEKHEALQRLFPPRDFEVLYNLECSKLCAEFQADLRFHFSLGLSALFERFTGSSLRTEEWNRLLHSTSKTASLTPFTSPSSMVSMSLVALASRLIGMRILVTCTILYAILYVYERATWNDKSKREAYKKQYCCHANRKISPLTDLLCSSCSMQVESQLVHLYNGSVGLLVGYEKEVEDGMEEKRITVGRLDHIAQQAKHFSLKHEEIHEQLETFKQIYNL